MLVSGHRLQNFKNFMYKVSPQPTSKISGYDNGVVQHFGHIWNWNWIVKNAWISRQPELDIWTSLLNTDKTGASCTKIAQTTEGEVNSIAGKDDWFLAITTHFTISSQVKQSTLHTYTQHSHSSSNTVHYSYTSHSAWAESIQLITLYYIL